MTKNLEQKEGIKEALTLLHNGGNYTNAQFALFDNMLHILLLNNFFIFEDYFYSQ